MNNTHKYNGFKLISLEIRDSSLLSTKSILYNFLEEQDDQKNIYVSVLIGPNGTGKSNLFRIIIDLFKELYDLSIGNQRSYNVDGRFNLKYSIDNNIFEYTNIHRKDLDLTEINKSSKNPAYLLKNGNKIEFNLVQLPTSIVANSIMLTDKYPVYSNEKVFPIYKYLGVRNRPQNASTRSYVRKTVEFIVQQHQSTHFNNGLTKIARFLGLTRSMEIYYETSNTHIFFKGDLSPSNLANYFNDIRKRYKNSPTQPPYKLNYFNKIRKDGKLIEQICRFCNNLHKKKRLKDVPRSVIKRISYNLADANDITLLKEDFKSLEHLRELGLVYPPEIYLEKEGKYTLAESSSGEYHFLSAIVGLMASLENNSLVLIDEPEVSLHPNWQMQYLSFLREIFSESLYSTSQILIATHSHFLISDLKGKNSKIICLKRNEQIEIIDLPEGIDTYSWSAEDVLYNIFDVASTRNKFVAEKIADILDSLSKNEIDSVHKIQNDTYDTLVNLQKTLKDNDPLKEVVNAILTKVSIE